MARAAGGSIRALVVSVRVRGTFGSPRTAMAGRFGGDGCGLVSPVDCFGRVRGGVECAGHVRQGTREVRLAYDLGAPEKRGGSGARDASEDVHHRDDAADREHVARDQGHSRVLHVYLRTL